MGEPPHLFIGIPVNYKNVLAAVASMHAFSKKEFQIIQILRVCIAKYVHHQDVALL